MACFQPIPTPCKHLPTASSASTWSLGPVRESCLGCAAVTQPVALARTPGCPPSCNTEDNHSSARWQHSWRPWDLATPLPFQGASVPFYKQQGWRGGRQDDMLQHHPLRGLSWGHPSSQHPQRGCRELVEGLQNVLRRMPVHSGCALHSCAGDSQWPTHLCPSPTGWP